MYGRMVEELGWQEQRADPELPAKVWSHRVRRSRLPRLDSPYSSERLVHRVLVLEVGRLNPPETLRFRVLGFAQTTAWKLVET